MEDDFCSPSGQERQNFETDTNCGIPSTGPFKLQNPLNGIILCLKKSRERTIATNDTICISIYGGKYFNKTVTTFQVD